MNIKCLTLIWDCQLILKWNNVSFYIFCIEVCIILICRKLISCMMWTSRGSRARTSRDSPVIQYLVLHHKLYYYPVLREPMIPVLEGFYLIDSHQNEIYIKQGIISPQILVQLQNVKFWAAISFLYVLLYFTHKFDLWVMKTRSLVSYLEDENISGYVPNLCLDHFFVLFAIKMRRISASSNIEKNIA